MVLCGDAYAACLLGVMWREVVSDRYMGDTNEIKSPGAVAGGVVAAHAMTPAHACVAGQRKLSFLIWCEQHQIRK